MVVNFFEIRLWANFAGSLCYKFSQVHVEDRKTEEC